MLEVKFANDPCQHKVPPQLSLNLQLFLAPTQLFFLDIKFEVAIATFKNLLNLAFLKKCLNKTDIEKVG